MGILTEFRILVVLLTLKLIFHGALFGHHFSSRDLHIVNNELISKEGVLLVLTLEILDRNQHFLNVFENLILLVYSPIYNHLIRFIFGK